MIFTTDDILELKACLDLDHFSTKYSCGPIKHLMLERDLKISKDNALVFVLWQMIFNHNTQILAFDWNHDQAKTTTNELYDLIAKLPDIMKPSIIRKLANEFQIENGSRFTACRPDAMYAKGRSLSHMLINDDLDYDVKNNILYSVLPCVIHNEEAKIIYFK